MKRRDLIKRWCALIFAILLCILSACGSGNFLELGESFDESFGTNGTLVYTVKSASVSQSAEDGCFVEDAHVTVDGVSYINPDFITSDGLISGASLVLLELEVQNVDADNAGMYDEPYVFRADSIVTLADLSKKSGGSYSYIDAAYFSLLNGRSEHSMAYELKPGESITFTLGFLVGSGHSLSDLCACDSSGNADSNFVRLGLTE